eukprot:TRINITY_DN95629_c0_g1_i1.p1 TRINITY_DN95629_c0_g1~~TRINITY_DN95629_c0_g1_i1.p1  ORF type:complete len:589 (+),score=93.63 TRINITY_DN95629_c0_g1_i1:129-1895(+)
MASEGEASTSWSQTLEDAWRTFRQQVSAGMGQAADGMTADSLKPSLCNGSPCHGIKVDRCGCLNAQTADSNVIVLALDALDDEWGETPVLQSDQAAFRVEGRCLCGAVELVVTGEPMMRLLCHCEDCRRWTGSVGQLSSMYRRHQVELTGPTISFRKNASSSNIRRCCATCYSLIYNDHLDPSSNLVDICSGILESEFKPSAHLFYEERIMQIDDDVRKWCNMPVEMGGSGRIAIGEAMKWLEPKAQTVGRCLCGAVSVRAEGEPSARQLCHCKDCQRWTGSLGRMSFSYPTTSVQLSGDLLAFHSSACTSVRKCCAACHSRVMTEHHDGIVEICAGILEAAFYPGVHLHPSERLMSLEPRNYPAQMIASRDLSPTSKASFDDWVTREPAARLVSMTTLAPCKTFDIVLIRESNKQAGMSLDTSSETLTVVNRVSEGGLLAAWNSTCKDADCIVKPLDRLIAVNGFAGTAKEMVKRIKGKEKQLKLTFERPAERVVSVDKSGGPLGVALSDDESVDTKACLRIEEVMEGGLLQKWNETAPADKQVRPHDRIIAVNGVTDSSAEIRQMLEQKSAMLNIKLCSWSFNVET